MITRDQFITLARMGNLEEVKNALKKDAKLIDSIDRDQYNTLHHAAWNGHVDLVKFLLTQKSSYLNSQAYNGNTPLICAAYYGYVDVIKVLVEQDKVDVNLTNSKGNSVLHILSEELSKSSSEEKLLIYIKAIEYLLTKANINQKNTAGETPLMLTENIQLFHKLLEAKPNLEITDNLGETVFLKACKNADIAKISALIKAKVNINASAHNKKSAFDFILDLHQTSVKDSTIKKLIKLLLSLNDPKFDEAHIENAFNQALLNKDTKKLQLLNSLDIKFTKSTTFFKTMELAYYAGNFHQLFETIPKDVKPNEPEIVDEKGNSLLMRAIIDNQIDIALKLVPFFDVTRVNKQGKTCLSLLLQKHQINLDLLNLLFKKGANPNEKNKEGIPYFIENISNGPISQLFIEYGADLNYVSKSRGDTTLILATKARNEIAVKLILEKNPSLIPIKNKIDRDALFTAVFDVIDISEYTKYEKIISMLLMAKANPFTECTAAHDLKSTAYDFSRYHHKLRGLFEPYTSLKHLYVATSQSEAGSISQLTSSAHSTSTSLSKTQATLFAEKKYDSMSEIPLPSVDHLNQILGMSRLVTSIDKDSKVLQEAFIIKFNIHFHPDYYKSILQEKLLNNIADVALQIDASNIQLVIKAKDYHQFMENMTQAMLKQLNFS